MSNSPEFIQLLRDQSPHDESLHSTLLRALWAYDPNAKPIGIIGNSGSWINSPFIHKDYEHIFHRYPDHVLLEIIDVELSVNGKGNLLFDNPTNYTSQIKPTFFSGRRARMRATSNLDIRYCQFCIEEGIKKVGYGYFRHFWSVSDKCLIHNQPLERLPELGFNKSLKIVKRLLRGKRFKNSLSAQGFQPTSRRSRTYTAHATWDTRDQYFFPIKFAPGCLMKNFAEWIWESHHEFKDPGLKSFAEKVSGQYLHKFREMYEFDYRRDFAGVYLLCSSFEAEKLNEFFAENVTLIWLNLGPRKQGRLKEVFAKKKGKNCETCEQKSCHLKGSKELRLVDPQKISFQYLCENSYTLSRIVMQQRPIAVLGSSVWGALNVMVNPSEKLEISAYQVRLGDDRE